jgi:hypothetical protein
MGKKPQISATLPAHVHDAITRRADLLDDSKSNYLSAIASWWFGQGCPPVRPDEQHLGKILNPKGAESHLFSEIKKRVRPPPKNLDVWHLDEKSVYQLIDDKVIQPLLAQLGVPNLFAHAIEHDELHSFAAFDNHPTHWIVLHLFKGLESEEGNGLLFEALPKDSTSREELLARLKKDAAKMGAKEEVVFSQLPTIPAKIS